MKRNSSLDVLRCALMLGIILLHIVATPERWANWRHVAYLLYVCVVGFVFISGYFSIRFSMKKILKLYGTTLWCMAVLWLLIPLSGREAVDVFKRLWFLHAYVFLMCFAPIVNKLFEQKNERFLIPVLTVVFGWGFLSNLAFVHHFVPQTPGLTAHSGLTLIGIYIAARYYRVNEVKFDRIPTSCYWAGIPLAAGLSTLGMGWFGAYNSPVALLYALCIFHVVKKISFPQFAGQTAIFLAPSVFSVYLLHANKHVYSIFDIAIRYLHKSGVFGGGAFIIVGIGAFTIAVALDLPRRFFVWTLSKLVK